MRWPAHTGLCVTTAGTQEPGKAHRHLAEQCGDAVQPPVFHMAPAIAGTIGRPQHRVVADLRGDDLLLNERQQRLPFVQGQTQVGGILKTVGSMELHEFLLIPTPSRFGAGASIG